MLLRYGGASHIGSLSSRFFRLRSRSLGDSSHELVPESFDLVGLTGSIRDLTSVGCGVYQPLFGEAEGRPVASKSGRIPEQLFPTLRSSNPSSGS